MYAIQTLVDAASLGSLYALVALGIGLIFGIMRLINFAHGDFITIGGYLLIVPSTSAAATLLIGGWHWALMVPTIILLVMLLALGVERIAFRPLRSTPPATLLVSSFAVGFFLQHALLLIYSSRPKSVGIGGQLNTVINLGGIRFPLLDIFIIVVTAILLISITAFLRWTRYGIWMRASSENFSMARILGVRANTVIGLAFAISGLLAATVSFFLVIKGGLLSYRMGVPLVLMGFVATVVGGMGSLTGAVVGGYLVGGISVLLQSVLPHWLRDGRDAFVFAAVILILLIRPGGLFQTSAFKERV